MAYQTLKYRLTGAVPLIMHSSRLADPLNQFAKDLKKVSSKRAKTEADHEQMAKIEFAGSLYTNHDGPILPSEVIEAAFIGGAKKLKLGTAAKAGVICPEDVPLEYEGPRTREELWEDERFISRASVKVQKNRVMRTRPIFKEWSATVVLDVNDEILSPDQADECFQRCASEVGIGTWRPKYGRFYVERLAQGPSDTA